MNDVTFKIIQMVIYLVLIGICLFVTRYVVPMIKQNIGESKFNIIESYVEKVVDTAEIIFDGEGLGEQKKDYAVNAISNISKQMGYKITEEQIGILIESAVKAMNDFKEL